MQVARRNALTSIATAIATAFSELALAHTRIAFDILSGILLPSYIKNVPIHQQAVLVAMHYFLPLRYRPAKEPHGTTSSTRAVR